MYNSLERERERETVACLYIGLILTTAAAERVAMATRAMVSDFDKRHTSPQVKRGLLSAVVAAAAVKVKLFST